MPERSPTAPGGATWSARHEGIDPAGVPLLRAWLRLVGLAARPVRRVPPDVLSGLGVASAAGATHLAARGHPGRAVAPVLLAALLDGVDGAVAQASGRVSAHGRALDSACDRAVELCLVGALVRGAGVPAAAGAALVGVTAGVELRRARAGSHLRLTVWERPSRVVLAVVGLTSAARAPGARGWTGPVVGAVGTGLAAAALLQLSRG